MERARSEILHDVGNAIAIARANVEAMLDGVMDVTPERLKNVADALRDAGEKLAEAHQK